MVTPRRKWLRHEDLEIQRRPCVKREEFLDYMTFLRNDRPLFTEIFGPIVGLKEEWEDQGATPEELDFSAFTYRTENRFSVPVVTGWLGGGESKVLEETNEYQILRDHKGRRIKIPLGFATVALPMEYPVKTMDDWRKIKQHYAFFEERFTPGWQEAVMEHYHAGDVIQIGIPGGFDEPRDLMGDEQTCLCYYDDPELMHDILSAISDCVAEVLDRVTRKVPLDMVFIHEDMAGKSGPLVGPNLVREFISPYYRRTWDIASSRGARLFDQDSDGNMNDLIEPFLEAGVNCMHPFEPAANMDIVKIRERYGTRLSFYGGIDKFVLRKTQEDILRELEYKIPPMVASGGCKLGLDHRIPNGTPLENYKFYIQKSWEILNREAAKLP